MPYSHETALELDYETERRARIVERSVRPEIGEIDGDRSTASLVRDGRTVRITVRASDLVALRAGMNTWLTLVGVAERSSAANQSSGEFR